jgi:type III secretion protein L
LKFFRLIRGDQVRRATGQKVVRADTFSKLLSAKELIEEVQEDALRYRQEVAAESEQLKEKAEQTGYEQGLEAWAEQVALLEREISKVAEEVKQLIIPVALQAAKKIVGREMTLNPETIADIVATHLKAVAGHRRITVFCHKDDVEKIRAKKPQLEALFERLESLSIQERDDIQQGGCIIETEAGIINAQPDQVWRALEAVFERILQQP